MKLENILIPLLFVVGLGLGTTLAIKDFKKEVRNGKSIVIGWLSQFGFMPLFAYAMAKAFRLPDNVAVGMVLVGCSPGGSTSNLFTYWSHGNLPLSITMSVASTVCSLFMLPLLSFLYITKTDLTKNAVALDFVNIILTLLLIVLPCLAGIWIRHVNTVKQCGGKFMYKWVEKIASITGAIFLIGALAFGIYENPQLFSSKWTYWLSAGLMEPVGAAFGYLVSILFKRTPKDRRTIALETGVQNSTFTISIVALSFSAAGQKDLRNEVLTIPLLYSFFYVVHSTWLVLVLRQLASEEDASTTINNAREGHLAQPDGVVPVPSPRQQVELEAQQSPSSGGSRNMSELY